MRRLASGRTKWIALGVLVGVSAVIVGAFAVTRESTPATTAPSATIDCGELSTKQERLACFTTSFEKLVKARGVIDAIAYTQKKAATDDALSAACHLSWHPIGEAEGKRASTAGEPLPDVPRELSYCADGYIHGVLIGYLSLDGSENIAEACAEQRFTTGVVNCIHAYGHAFARASRNDIGPAIESCSAFADQVALQAELDAPEQECHYGLFMERTLQDMAEGKSEPLNNCTDVPEVAWYGCYTFLPGRVVAITGNWSEAIKMCDSLDNAFQHETCADSVYQSLPKAAMCDNFRASADKALCRTTVSAQR